MEKYNEDIFSQLTNNNEAQFWYRARHYVLDVLPPLDGKGIDRNSSDHVHVVLEDISELMIAVARQIALVAHYLNYDEENGENRTVITFCKCDKEINIENISANEGVSLGYLLEHCRSSYIDESGVESEIHRENPTLPLDIEFQFTNRLIGWYEQETGSNGNKEKYIVIKNEDIPEAADDNSIDVSKGMLVNMVYYVGDEIGNLPSTDNANIPRYTAALNMFCYKLKVENIEEKWENNKTTDKLSSIFCADCFESRLRGILNTDKKSLSEYIVDDFEAVMKTLKDENTIQAIVKSEHARWNVEKLIMGFRPLNAKERYKDETLFGDEKATYRKRLKKKEQVHIDLGSYHNLRRIDPGNMKYDYFLMLAMPQILLSTL